MNTICNFVTMIISASVTGSIFALIWIILIRFFDKYLRTDFINFSLKCVIVSFYIPSMVIILAIKEHFVEGKEIYYAVYTNIMRIILCGIFIIFAAMLAREIYKWILGNIELDKSIIVRASVDDDVMEVVEALKKKLMIRRKFKVYKALGIGSPYIVGAFKPCIYLTADRMSKEDLEVTLTHELCHYKQRDNYFKPLASIMCCLNWFNPLAWYIKEEYKIWAEGGSDYKCITIGGYTLDDYFDSLIRTANNVVDGFSSYVSMSASKSQIYDRAVLVSKYSNKKINKGIFSAILICSLIVGSTTVYAATDLTETVFNFIFTKSSEQFEEYTQVCEDGYIEHIEKSELNKEPVYIEAFSEADNKERKINESLVIQLPKENEEFIILNVLNIEEKGVLGISTTLFDEGKSMCVGIIEPDGTKRYIEGGNMYHMFDITKSGDYKVYIINNNDEPVEVIVSVLYNQDK